MLFLLSIHLKISIMKNFQINGNELLVYMPEKQKLVKIDEGEINNVHDVFISVKNKGSLNLYQETDIGLFAGPKNVHEAVPIGGLVVFRRQSIWRYGGFFDQEKVLGTVVEEMPGVYRKVHGELVILVRNYPEEKLPFISNYWPSVKPQTVKYKSLMKVTDLYLEQQENEYSSSREELLLLEQTDGSYLALRPLRKIAVQFYNGPYIQFKTNENQAVVLAFENGAYHKIYEGENLHNLKNAIIRKDGEQIQLLQYCRSSVRLEVIARGSRLSLVEDPEGRRDTMLTLDDKKWLVSVGCLRKVILDSETEASKQKPEKWSLRKWFGIGRYSKP